MKITANKIYTFFLFFRINLNIYVFKMLHLWEHKFIRLHIFPQFPAHPQTSTRIFNVFKQPHYCPWWTFIIPFMALKVTAEHKSIDMLQIGFGERLQHRFFLNRFPEIQIFWRDLFCFLKRNSTLPIEIWSFFVGSHMSRQFHSNYCVFTANRKKKICWFLPTHTNIPEVNELKHTYRC